MSNTPGPLGGQNQPHSDSERLAGRINQALDRAGDSARANFSQQQIEKDATNAGRAIGAVLGVGCVLVVLLVVVVVLVALFAS